MPVQPIGADTATGALPAPVEARIENIFGATVADHLPVTAGAALHRASSTPVAVAANTETQISFDTETRVDPGFTADLTADTITVPYAGYYFLSAGVSIAAPGTGARTILTVMDASTSEVYARGFVVGATSSYRAVAEGAVYLAAGTVLKASMYVVSAGLSYEGDADQRWTSFTALFLGTAADSVFLTDDGAPQRVGARLLPSPGAPGADYVKWQGFHDDPTGMAIATLKVEGDSDDVNIDGWVGVKHGKDYADTPGYADTYQSYTLAGSAGTIAGNNNFVELDPDAPYAIPETWTANGYYRFELGPAWPKSEVGRFNNRGDFMVGHTRLGVRTATQTGTTVTLSGGSGVDASIVGAYVVWAGAGSNGTADKITGWIDGTHVTVETPRSIPVAEGVELWAPKILLGANGSIKPQTFTTGTRPSAAAVGAGAMVYDTTISKPIWSNGTVWKDAAGTTV